MIYTDQDEDSVSPPEVIVRSVCKHIKKATGIGNINPSMVIPISSRWYKFSRNLESATPSTHRKHRDRVIRALSDYPFVESENNEQSLLAIPPSKLIEMLDRASNMALLKYRFVSLLDLKLMYI